jgi:hypothetical protein
MNPNEALHIIDQMGVALRSNRERAATVFLNDPEGLSTIVPIVFDPTYKNHHKAAWIVEIIAERDLQLLYPFLGIFASHVSVVKKDSAVRSMAKICRWIALRYVKQKEKLILDALSISDVLKIVEVGFDWMIGPYPVAPKAYTMDTLYAFGSLDHPDLKWVHDSLKDVILQQIQKGCPGFQNHGEKILGKIGYRSEY